MLSYLVSLEILHWLGSTCCPGIWTILKGMCMMCIFFIHSQACRLSHIWEPMRVENAFLCLVPFILVLKFCWPVCFQNMSSLMTKPTKWHVRLAKTQVSLGIHPVWSESSLCAWRRLGFSATHEVHSEYSDQTGRMPRLIWVFTGHTCHFIGLS